MSQDSFATPTVNEDTATDLHEQLSMTTDMSVKAQHGYVRKILAEIKIGFPKRLV